MDALDDDYAIAPLWDVDACSAYLGVSRRTIMKWVKDGLIPRTYIPDDPDGKIKKRLLRFEPLVIQEWVRGDSNEAYVLRVIR